jgi:hypothetical protein
MFLKIFVSGSCIPLRYDPQIVFVISEYEKILLEKPCKALSY